MQQFSNAKVEKADAENAIVLWSIWGDDRMTEIHSQHEPLSDAMLVDGLVVLLSVEQQGERHFRGRRRPGGIGRVYGGQVVAQALAAAYATVSPDRPVHSLHAYFLRPGSEDHEIDYYVEADFDGGSFSNRRVVAAQQGEVILNLTASFHRFADGLEHAKAMPSVAAPEGLKTMREYAQEYAHRLDPLALHVYTRPSPLDMRPLGDPPFARVDPDDGPLAFWFRTKATLDHPQSLHRAILAFASDLSLLSSATRRHGNPLGLTKASIDHAVWFHGDVQADDWLLYVTESPWAGQGRGLGLGRIYDRAGRLLASSAQEGLMRLPRAAS